jgi:hypothetical protein
LHFLSVCRLWLLCGCNRVGSSSLLAYDTHLF